LPPFLRTCMSSVCLLLLIGVTDAYGMGNASSSSSNLLISDFCYRYNNSLAFIVASTLDFQSFMISRREHWILLVLVITFSISIFTIHNYFREIKALFRALINLRITRQIYREQEKTMPTYALLLSLVFTFSGGIYIYLLLKFIQSDLPFSGFPLYMVCVITLAAIYLGKYITLKVVGLIFSI